jgi:hypothetical protein
VSDATRRRDRARAFIDQQPEPAGGTSNVASMLQRMCVAAVYALPASGAGVSLMADHGARGFAAASDRSSQQLEELQFTLGEGPCMDAFATGRPVLIPDINEGVMTRWPMYAPAVHDRGVRAVFAFPLQVGASRVGVLDVFRDQPGSMTADELSQAMTFADIALTMVLDGQARAPAGGVPEGFHEAPGFRAEIAQAQGMIMVQLGVSITEALVRLRAYAYAEGRLVGDVARDVVARRVQFDPLGP